MNIFLALTAGFIFFAVLAWGLCKSASRGDELLDENELQDGSIKPEEPVNLVKMLRDSKQIR